VTSLLPSPETLTSIFTQEVEQLGGSVHSAIRSNGTLFFRATFPVSKDVQPGDTIRHGLALRTRGQDLIVHPYTFREICLNGAIHVDRLASQSIARTTEPWLSAGIEAQLRQALRAAASPDILAQNVDEMRDALSREVRLALTLGPMMERLRDPDLVSRILRTFRADGDRSTYGLMNAVTAVARVEPDPERKWILEELGGGVLKRIVPAPRVPGSVQGIPQRLRLQRRAPVDQPISPAERRETAEV